jgi:hypothetical protein
MNQSTTFWRIPLSFLKHKTLLDLGRGHNNEF